MGITWTPETMNANGGTEIMSRALEARVSSELLDHFQIVPSRLTSELDNTKIRIFWAHDLPEDPAAINALGDGGWRRFHRIVAVSNWQMQRFIERFGIDWNRCAVLQNAIIPMPPKPAVDDKIRLVYTSTPQRGLDVLTSVFEQIPGDDLVLEVFSSFKLYSWDEADAPFEPLFDKLRSDPRVVYHGAQPNDKVREGLARSHIFAYPSTWVETSCICLMEAMSAELVCVHPNNGALFETAANMTMMYQWNADKNAHAGTFKAVLESAIEVVRSNSDEHRVRLASQKSYADLFYNWEARAHQWDAFLRSIVDLPRAIDQGPMFEYRVSA